MTGDGLNDGAGQRFGCGQCWPDGAQEAWDARRIFTNVRELIHESHFHVMILTCPHCGQSFVSVFTEMIDWVDGDDSQYWSMVPVTGPEADDLARQRGSVTEEKLNALGRSRRCLRRDYPKGAEPKVFWGSGMSIGWHD